MLEERERARVGMAVRRHLLECGASAQPERLLSDLLVAAGVAGGPGGEVAQRLEDAAGEEGIRPWVHGPTTHTGAQ
jgi:hypothetical protein